MNITSFKCACCGAELKYSPGSGSLKCEYCGTEFEAEAAEAMADAAADAAQDENINWRHTNPEALENDENSCNYSCSSCGAQITGDKSLAASFCPYCGNTVVMNNRLEGMLRPDYIITFKVDKQAAVSKFKAFCKGKPLLPGGFISGGRIDKIEGLYVPYWLFDAGVKGQVRFRGERVHTHREGDYRVTRTKHYMLYREGAMDFEHVPVDGTSKLGGEITEAVEPFDMNGAREFTKAYLSGFLADRYDVEQEACKPRAAERIKKSLTSALANTCMGYSGVHPVGQSLTVSNGRIAYALLPMWLMTVSYNGKSYTFAMNGQTGKFVGELPISWGKAFGFFAGITAAVTIAVTLIMNFYG